MTLDHILAEFDLKMAEALQHAAEKVNRWKMRQRVIQYHLNSRDSYHLIHPFSHYCGIPVADLISGKAEWPEGH